MRFLCLGLISTLLAIAAPIGCGDVADDGSAGAGDTDRDRGRRLPDLGARADAGQDRGGSDNGGPVVDTAPDLDPNLTCFVDEDGDGSYALSCGGQDCDDNNRLRSPELNEGCDAFDNNCNNEVNEGLECTFYAHTGSDLFRIDPFSASSYRVADVPTDLWDIDTHPDGTLYGVNEDALYRLDTGDNQWRHVGNLDHAGGDANGMAIDLDGRAYLTAGNSLYTIDLTTARTELVGAMGSNFESSGDCVVNKDNSLFMSSRHREGTDSLIIVNGGTGTASEIGTIGFTSVFGLTAAWGHLFALTSAGELIEIDENTGHGTLVRDWGERRWYGAASTPNR